MPFVKRRLNRWHAKDVVQWAWKDTYWLHGMKVQNQMIEKYDVLSSESFVSSLINIQFWWSQMVLIKWEAYITILCNLPQHNYNLIFLRGISRCRFHGREIITQLDLDWNYVFKMLKITTMYMFCIIKRKSHRTWMPRMRLKWKVSFHCRTLFLMQCGSISIHIEAIYGKTPKPISF